MSPTIITTTTTTTATATQGIQKRFLIIRLQVHVELLQVGGQRAAVTLGTTQVRQHSDNKIPQHKDSPNAFVMEGENKTEDRLQWR